MAEQLRSDVISLWMTMLTISGHNRVKYRNMTPVSRSKRCEWHAKLNFNILWIYQITKTPWDDVIKTISVSYATSTIVRLSSLCNCQLFFYSSYHPPLTVQPIQENPRANHAKHTRPNRRVTVISKAKLCICNHKLSLWVITTSVKHLMLKTKRNVVTPRLDLILSNLLQVFYDWHTVWL